MTVRIDVPTLSSIDLPAKRKKNKRKIRSIRKSPEKKVLREVEVETKRSKLDSLLQRKLNQDHHLPIPKIRSSKKKEPER